MGTKISYLGNEMISPDGADIAALQADVTKLQETGGGVPTIEISSFDDFRAVEPGTYTFKMMQDISFNLNNSFGTALGSWGLEKGVQGFFTKTSTTPYDGYIYYAQKMVSKRNCIYFNESYIENVSDFLQFQEAMREFTLDRTMWTRAGFGPFLENVPTNTTLMSGPTFYTASDHDIIVDLSDKWESIKNKILYVYSKQMSRFVIDYSVTQRYYIAKNVSGLCRIAFGYIDDDATRQYLQDNIRIFAVPSEISTYPDPVYTGNKTKNEVIDWVNPNRAIAVIGDSISQGVGSINNWPTELQKILGIGKLYNFAVSGTAYSSAGGRTTFEGQINSLKDKLENPDTDIVISHIFVMGGINDWAAQADASVFTNAVIDRFEELAALPTTAPVYIISPLNIAYGKNYGNDTNPNMNIKTIRDILKKQSMVRGFNYIDGSEFKLPVNKNGIGGVDNEAYISDGLHLAKAGQRYVAWKIANMLAGAEDFENHKYSTTETFTGNYWVDGRPIYRKVIKFNNLAHGTTGGSYVVDATLTSTYCTIIKFEGYSDNMGANLPINYNSTTLETSLFQDYSDGLKISITADPNYSAGFTAIVEYAKN